MYQIDFLIYKPVYYVYGLLWSIIHVDDSDTLKKEDTPPPRETFNIVCPPPKPSIPLVDCTRRSICG